VLLFSAARIGHTWDKERKKKGERKKNTVKKESQEVEEEK
jgi:hypothetical protein